MTGPRIVAVRSSLMRELATAINATAGMSTVEVGFQHPTGNDMPREVVWTQSGRPSFSTAALGAGRNRLDDRSTFDLMIRAGGPNVSPEEAAQRVIDIATVAVEWIGDHKNGEALAVPGLLSIVVDGEGDSEEFPWDSGHAAGIRIPIRYTARLT